MGLDHDGRGHEIGELPVGRSQLERVVLGGELGRVVQVLLDPGVDTRDVLGAVFQYTLAEGAEHRRSLDLHLELTLGVPGGHVDASVHVEVRGGCPQELGDVPSSQVPQHVRFEQAVLRRDVAGSPHGVVPGGSVDVRDAPPVPDDGQPRLRVFGGNDVPGRELHRLGLEVGTQVSIRDLARGQRKLPVHVQLVDPVGRVLLGQLVLQCLGQVHGVPLARGQDVQEQPVVRLGPEPGRRSRHWLHGEGQAHRQRRQDPDHARPHPEPPFCGEMTAGAPGIGADP